VKYQLRAGGGTGEGAAGYAARMRLWIMAVLFLAACAKPTATTGAPVTTCTKSGDSCQYAEGKIGVCTANGMDCDGGAACLVCMSLH
jgi:hypothetical protein